jgi:hypothetical protein
LKGAKRRKWRQLNRNAKARWLKAQNATAEPKSDEEEI